MTCQAFQGRGSDTSERAVMLPMGLPVPVAALQAACDPYRSSPWPVTVSKALVRAQLARRAFQSQPVPLSPAVTAEEHAARIAYFVVHGWPDPIGIDVGVPELGCTVAWPIQDGNHRFAAAIYRGDESILAEVDGSVGYAEELLGVQI